MRKILSQPLWQYSLIGIFAVVIFLVHYLISGQAVYGDGIGYFAHLHTWVIDQDFDHTNEYKHIYNHANNNAMEPVTSSVIQIVATNTDNKAENHYSPGVALLLLPFYSLAHGFVYLLHFYGYPISTSGYGDIYQIMSGLGAVAYVVVGLWLLEQVVAKFVQDRAMSRLATLGIFLSTNLLYYGSFDVLNSHFASFFLMTYFVYLFIQDNKTAWYQFNLGLVAGLLITNRLQDGAVLIIWLVDAARDIYEVKNTTFNFFTKKLPPFGLGLFLMVVPLLIHWGTVFADVTQHTYLRGLFALYTDSKLPNFIGSLVHPMTGLFTRSPLLLVSYIYFLFFILPKKNWQLLLLYAFFIIQYVVITIQGGWQAAAYGGRMYISCLVFFAIALGDLLVTVKQKHRLAPFVIVVVFVLFNLLSMASFILLEKGAEAGKKGTEVRTIERLQSWQRRIFPQ